MHEVSKVPIFKTLSRYQPCSLRWTQDGATGSDSLVNIGFNRFEKFHFPRSLYSVALEFVALTMMMMMIVIILLKTLCGKALPIRRNRQQIECINKKN